MGQLVQFKVIDQNGNAIVGAKVTGHSKCGGVFGGGANFSGTTDESGLTNQLDTGCTLGGQATATASANGYQSNTINFVISDCSAGIFCNTQQETISLNAISGNCSPTNPCPSGYTCQNGTCVAVNKTKSYTWDNILNYIQSHWLLIVVFIFVIAIIFIMVKKPETFSAFGRSVKSAGKSAGSYMKNLMG